MQLSRQKPCRGSAACPCRGMKNTSRFADIEAARTAVNLALPFIEKTLERPGVSARKVLHVVVLDPAATCDCSNFEEALLYEHSVGDCHNWDADYAAFARDKARLSWCHQMGSRHLIHMEPHRLSLSDTLLWGSVWLDGIVVAASGAMPAWDEAFSLCVAGNLRAIALERSTGMPIAKSQGD